MLFWAKDPELKIESPAAAAAALEITFHMGVVFVT